MNKINAHNMILGDSHMHTWFSTDCDSSVRSMLDAAISKGLCSVCITDHMDLDFPPQEEGQDPNEMQFQFDLEEYFRVLLPLCEEYRGRLDVRIGIETGLQPHLGQSYHKLLEKYPFDYVIGSVHLVRGLDPYYKRFFEGRTDAEAYRDTFEETLMCLETSEEFDALGHLDYVVRYGNKQAEEYSYRAFADQIDEILKRLVSMGKGLEMNMAGIKYGLGFPNPHQDILKRYRELGGEIVTVGADAHRPEHVAYAFDQAVDILKSCGFKYYAEYKERKPIFRRLGA